MPQKTTSISALPVLLTETNTPSLRLQNQGVHPVMLQATAAIVESEHWNGSDAWEGAVILPPGEILLPDVTLALLFPSITDPVFLYARCAFGSADVSLSYFAEEAPAQ